MNLISLAIPWKFGDAISALKRLEGAWASVLSAYRYGGPLESVKVNSDAATVFVFGLVLTSANGIPILDPRARVTRKDRDLQESLGKRYRQLATNIYETKDGKYYHSHGRLGLLFFLS